MYYNAIVMRYNGIVSINNGNVTANNGGTAVYIGIVKVEKRKIVFFFYPPKMICLHICNSTSGSIIYNLQSGYFIC